MLLQQEAGDIIHDSINGVRKINNLESNPNNTRKHFLRAPVITDGPKEKAHLVKKKKQNLRVENFNLFVPQGGRRYIEFTNGTNTREITAEMRVESDNVARKRREYIKKAMKHAWSGYKKYAFGADELLPLSKEAGGYWGGLGVTLVDSLDTLWLMGLKDEFWEARDWVQHKLSFHDVGAVSVFEVTIRSLGGLLSAYDLSGDPIFLEKADDLGSRLLHAFESPNGIPYGYTDLNGTTSHNGWSGNTARTVEAGSLQVEFRYLAHMTKKQIYREKAEGVFNIFLEHQPTIGLFPF